MKTVVNSLITLAALAIVSGCAPSNPQMTGTPPPPKVPPPTPTPVEFKKVAQEAEVAAKAVLAPKVDILFVIDNSDSMKTHQANLKKNVDKFVLAFNANKRLDFQIGVVSVFDSKRYGPVVKDFYPLGKLYPLKDPAHPGQTVEGPSFITRAPRYAEVLGETLKIGTIARGTDKNDLGGPEFEESFSPIAAAVDGRNPGFVREGAHLAVIMITDADDLSLITSSQLMNQLYEVKGGDSSAVSTFGVLALDLPRVKCKKDFGLEGNDPVKIPEFLAMSRGKAYSLCDSKFGDNLAEAGRIIEKRASRRIRIPLQAIPAAGTLKVTFSDDGREVPGWMYDAKRIQVVVPGDAAADRDGKAEVSISYTAIEDKHLNEGHAKPLSAK